MTIRYMGRRRLCREGPASDKLPCMSVYEKGLVTILIAPVLLAALLTSRSVRTLVMEHP